MAPPPYSREELKKMSISDLLAIAKRQKIKLAGELDKSELIKRILEESGGAKSFSLDFKKRWERLGDGSLLGTRTDDEGSLNLRSRRERELQKEMSKIEGYMSTRFKKHKEQEPKRSFFSGLDHLGVKKDKVEDTGPKREGRLSQASLSSRRGRVEDTEKELKDEMSKMEALLDMVIPSRQAKEEPEEKRHAPPPKVIALPPPKQAS